MTQMRRPDGTGGPLAEDERIDDIQFYVDPRAELLIDDIVLYDAAADGEKRPFPKRILFTGWFDTGKQGKEWPGDFEIVNHEKPRTWKCARAVGLAPGGRLDSPAPARRAPPGGRSRSCRSAIGSRTPTRCGSSWSTPRRSRPGGRSLPS